MNLIPNPKNYGKKTSPERLRAISLQNQRQIFNELPNFLTARRIGKRADIKTKEHIKANSKVTDHSKPKTVAETTANRFSQGTLFGIQWKWVI